LQHWLNAVAYQIQNCSTCQQLRSTLLVRFAQSLWLAIEMVGRLQSKVLLRAA
jgi:hypothetical protein